MYRADVLTELATLVTAGDLVITWRSSTWADWRRVAPGEARTTMPLVVLGSITSTALGLALALPHRRVVAIESDGSALMNTGIMATIGNERPSNLTVIVLDNGMYESIGGPPTLTAFHTDLARMAEGAGCLNCSTVRDVEDFAATAGRLLNDGEMGYLVAKIEPGGPPTPESAMSERAPSSPTDGVEDKYRFVRAIEALEGVEI